MLMSCACVTSTLIIDDKREINTQSIEVDQYPTALITILEGWRRAEGSKA